MKTDSTRTFLGIAISMNYHTSSLNNHCRNINTILIAKTESTHNITKIIITVSYVTTTK